jgi:ABC-type transport system involved in cytochrome c biogenesis permease subunit
VLTYNYDPWGIGITYTGYGLLLLAMIAFFFQKQSYFRSLVKSLTAKRSYNEVVLQRSGLIALAVLIVILAIIMTKVVTPKPPLQPVLQTPLLGIHVSVIMLAYTLFAVIMVNGILGLCWAQKREQLMHLSQLLLYPALFCLTAGIFIGAVWANMSWGRYWGWDPKETWALITMLVYALLLHFPWLKSLIAKRSNSAAVLQRSGHTTKWSIIYHICCVVDFALVLFTYFGVSYLLGGLHSYA